MERIERKKLTRRKLCLKARQDRFVSGYVKHKHPQVYSQANEWYKQLDEMYPDKRDLCKTLEFLRMTTGVKTYTEYYHLNRPNRKRKNETVEKSSKKQAQEKNSISDNMMLKIPLMKMSESILQRASTINDDESFLSITDQEYEAVIEELRNDPDLYAIYNDLNGEIADKNTYQDNIVDMSEVQQTEFNQDNIVDMSEVQQTEFTVEHTDENESFLNVPNQVYEEIIQELDQDPDLCSIFNDIDVDIEYDEQTPLERELASLGW